MVSNIFIIFVDLSFGGGRGKPIGRRKILNSHQNNGINFSPMKGMPLIQTKKIIQVGSSSCLKKTWGGEGLKILYNLPFLTVNKFGRWRNLHSMQSSKIRYGYVCYVMKFS